VGATHIARELLVPIKSRTCELGPFVKVIGVEDSSPV
jgi:hypothetical protein